MIERHITSELRVLLGEYPVVSILGPRQAGKTTLAKSLKGYDYSNLEQPEIREFAGRDPKAYLSRFSGPAVIDEIQRVPELLSYIQSVVDTRPGNGQFILTGSHQLALREALTQSLAGRTAILNLYPLTIGELASVGIHYNSPEEYIYQGFMPRVHDQKQRPTTAYSNYYQTYVERDVRQLINLKDASLFDRFMRLLAGRAGQLLDAASIAGDVGVSPNTIKSWLSILEASFVVFRLPPYFENFGKRVVKSPKYYFTDTGLLAFLLGIENPAQVARDPLVGQLFENLVILEALKLRANQGKLPELYFYRDSNGNEADLLLPQGRNLHIFEIKSASTYSDKLLKSLRRIAGLSPSINRASLIYAGEPLEFSDGIDACRYDNLQEIL